MKLNRWIETNEIPVEIYYKGGFSNLYFKFNVVGDFSNIKIININDELENDFKPVVIKTIYLNRVIQLAKILSTLTEYDENSDTVKEFIKFVMDNKDIITSNDVANIPKNIVPIKFIGEQLARIGIKQKSHRKGAKNNQRRFYKLDIDQEIKIKEKPLKYSIEIIYKIKKLNKRGI